MFDHPVASRILPDWYNNSRSKSKNTGPGQGEAGEEIDLLLYHYLTLLTRRGVKCPSREGNQGQQHTVVNTHTNRQTTTRVAAIKQLTKNLKEPRSMELTPSRQIHVELRKEKSKLALERTPLATRGTVSLFHETSANPEIHKHRALT